MARDSRSKVYVGDLGYGTTKEELEEKFSKYGPLRSVWIARKPPGFAFVEFEDARDAEDAVKALRGVQCGEGMKLINGDASVSAPRQLHIAMLSLRHFHALIYALWPFCDLDQQVSQFALLGRLTPSSLASSKMGFVKSKSRSQSRSVSPPPPRQRNRSRSSLFACQKSLLRSCLLSVQNYHWKKSLGTGHIRKYKLQCMKELKSSLLLICVGWFQELNNCQGIDGVHRCKRLHTTVSWQSFEI
ncbi:hypothetical protein BaRGS_00017286 [Batillaria attramentaria]|uniref:RRM domain-containing protein n=1 Tax=Batillaria attramentaria TaxID=370345 RepID=A0ABD0KXG4_9CAEN